VLHANLILFRQDVKTGFSLSTPTFSCPIVIRAIVASGLCPVNAPNNTIAL
jgi:hypothetical protein